MKSFDIGIVQTNLGLLVATFGNSGTVAIYTDLAERLSKIANIEDVWSWRYVQSVHKGSVAPSGKFARAVELLVAETDGMPALIADTEEVMIYAKPGTVRRNSIVLNGSKSCANPGCNIHFVPRVPWQKYCPRCRR